MYYYVITSQFEETESAYSNEASASPMGTVTLSMSDVSGAYDQGETFEVTISMDSPVNVYGFQRKSGLVKHSNDSVYIFNRFKHVTPLL